MRRFNLASSIGTRVVGAICLFAAIGAGLTHRHAAAAENVAWAVLMEVLAQDADRRLREERP